MSPLALLTHRGTNQKQTEQTLTNFVRKLNCQRNHKPGLTKQPPETSRKKAEKETTAQGLLQMWSGRIMQKRAPPRVSGLRAARCTEHKTPPFSIPVLVQQDLMLCYSLTAESIIILSFPKQEFSQPLLYYHSIEAYWVKWD